MVIKVSVGPNKSHFCRGDLEPHVLIKLVDPHFNLSAYCFEWGGGEEGAGVSTLSLESLYLL